MTVRAQRLVATALTALHLWGFASCLVYANFAADYPFVSGDVFDYLRTALVLGGVDLEYSGRPPLLPMVMATLRSAGALSWLPVLFLCVHHAFALLMFAELVATSRVAAWTSWGVLLLASSSLRWVMYLEPSLIGSYLLAASILLLSGRWSRHLLAPYLSGGLAGCAYFLHQLALIYPVVACLAALLGRRRPACLAVLAFLPWPMSWLGLKGLVFSNLGDVGISHWGLVSWHTDAALPYLVMGLALFGLPMMAVSLSGLARGLLSRDLTARLCAVTVALIVLFFVLLYDYAAQRFLLYTLPFVILWAAGALASIKNRRAAAAVGALLVWVAVLPRSASDEQTSIPLLPGLDLQVKIGLNPRVPGSFEGLRLGLASPGLINEHSPYSQLLASRNARPGSSPPFDTPRSTTVADLYVLAPGETYNPALRNRVQVLLERRVHLVPLVVVESLICSLEVRKVGDLAEMTVWQATLPDGRSTTLSHRADWRPFEGRLVDACAAASGTPDVTAAATLGEAWSSRHVGLLVDKVDPLLALALFWLKGELVVIGPGERPATRRLVLEASAGRSDFLMSIDGVWWRALLYRGKRQAPAPDADPPRHGRPVGS